MKPAIYIKRVYDKPLKKDGYRILVDRLWPRGLTKEEVSMDGWLKELAPSGDLRKWYGHDPDRWKEFRQKYLAELRDNESVISFVEGNKDKKVITLLYGAKDEAHTHALVLKEFLEKKFG